MSEKSIQYAYALIDKYSDVVNRMGKNTEKFQKQTESSFSKVIKKINLFGINVSSILSAEGIIQISKQIIKFGSDSVKAFQQQDEANKMVQKTLDITKNKVGKTFQQLSDSASNLQNKTFFGDEAILQNSTNTLLRFASITGDSFDRIQALSLDVAAGLRGTSAGAGDLMNASRMLGMALERPESGARMLRSMNIILTDSEQKLVTAMSKSGNVLGAREFLLKKIESVYKGNAEALALSSAGLDIQTKNIIGDMQEVIGEGIVPLKMEFQKGLIATLKESTPIILMVTKGLKHFFDYDWKYLINIFMAIKYIIMKLFEGLKPAFDNLLPALEKIYIIFSELLVDAIKEISDQMQFFIPFINMIVKTVTDLVDVIAPLINILKPLWMIAAKVIFFFIKLALLPLMIQIVLWKLLATLIKFIASFKIWGQMWNWVKNKIKSFYEWLKNSPLGKLIIAIFKPILEGWEKLKSMGKLLGLKDQTVQNISEQQHSQFSNPMINMKNNQNVNVKNKLEITVKAEKDTKVTKTKRDDTGRQR